MKILILYTYNKGLLSEFYQELSAMLYADGFEVDNFYLKNRDAYFEQNGVTVRGKKRRGFIYNYKAIYRIIKQSNPDVVISNFSYINPAVLFGKLLGVKRNIAWFHTAFGHAKPSTLKVWNKAAYLNMADIVLANSTKLQKEMHGVYRVSKEKTRCIPFWTNITERPFNTNLSRIIENNTALNIGCPGRLVADKNHTLVIETVYHLKQKHSRSIRLYIAGNGPYQRQLETLVKELNLEKEVVFLGLLNVDEMIALYKTMDVVVLPSFHEAFGLVFIEAIALGVPVLVSNAFGALDFIDNDKFSIDDFSFNPHSITELIEKLEPYLNDMGKSSDYLKAIYNETFDKKVIYNQVQAVILNQL